MSSYHIISQDSDFDFLPSYSLGESVLMVRRLSVEGLKGLSRMMIRLADSLDESRNNDDSSDNRVNAMLVEDNELIADQAEECMIPTRDRSGSVDSGIGDCEFDPETGLEVISLDEVSYHCTREDGWMVIYDKVYEVAEYLERGSHPGGEYVMMEYLGYDATMAFRGVGHSKGVARMLEKYCIGILPKVERLGMHADFT
jgi:cytochrome b involved in lipid metabolism